jgi:glutathione S-transferase
MRTSRRGALLALLAHLSGACAMAVTPPKIRLYTHTACPFAQRVWIALEAAHLPYERVDVNLYGSGGFDKAALRKVEAAGGLPPKGYIPVMAIGDEVVRESSVCVQRVAKLSEASESAASLQPADAALAAELIGLCDGLPARTSSRELEEMVRRADRALAGGSAFLAGESFSVADACLLPFLQRVEGDIPRDATHLLDYMARAHAHPAFAKTVMTSWWWWW